MGAASSFLETNIEVEQEFRQDGSDEENRRSGHDANSRPSPRPLHLIDMPDEILVMIAQAVRGWKRWDSVHECCPREYEARRGIQNLRLTCRRFRSISDEFHMDFMRVEMSNASLAKLERVSKHPALSRGVRVVYVQLHVYDDVLASDFDEFANYHKRHFRAKIQLMTYKGERQSEGRNPHQQGVSLDEDIHASVEKARQILQVWSYSRRDLEEDHLGYRALLRRAFEGYQRAYAEQQELINSGAFSARVTSAMATMPAAKRLVFMDCERCDCRRDDSFLAFRDELADDEKLCASLYEDRRIACLEQDFHGLGSDAIPMIPKLLASLDTAGVSITALSIHLTLLPDFSRLESTADLGSKIASAMRGLEEFSLLSIGPEKVHRSHEFKVMRKFLGPIVNAETLKTLSVRLNLWNSESFIDPAMLRPFGTINVWASWPALSSVTLESIPMLSSDLKHLLKAVQSPGGLVWMGSLHLMDGSWVDILELLRDRHQKAALFSPSGAECEAMSEAEYRRIFGNYYEWDERHIEYSRAVRYVRGRVKANPLLPSA